MKKQELLQIFDDELLDRLFGFCYSRTNDSHEAEELCSDIVFALMKAAHSDGKIDNLYPFIWKVARNVYADFSQRKSQSANLFYDGDADEILQSVEAPPETDNTDELIAAVYRRIAFLTKAYREVMILFYLQGLPVSQIAKLQNISETAVRQRLFAARQKIKSEVEKMSETDNKPVSLENIRFSIWGTGTPLWGDPRSVCVRQFSKHIVWLCHKKTMTASEIANELNVPTVYVEEELEILRKGENGQYGLLRRLQDGRYAINFILLDKDVMEQAQNLYLQKLPKVCDTVAAYIKANEQKYLGFSYLNHKTDSNLILWQQIFHIATAFEENVTQILSERYFNDIKSVDRPFSVFGYVYNGKSYGGGWDSVDAQNVCGFSAVHLDNIYITRIKKHFACGHNIACDIQIQLALRAIHGLDINSLSEEEKEHAAKAIEQGYLYRDKTMLYTKILVNSMQDSDRLFSVSNALCHGYFEIEAAELAEQLTKLMKKAIPEYLYGEWRFVNQLAGLPIIDTVAENLIDKGILVPPKDGVGAEGCWVSVK